MSAEGATREQIQPQIPTLRELAMVLFRRRRAFAWVTGAMFAATVLYALVGCKYKATMQVLVRKGRADAPVSATENAPLDLTRIAVSEEELNSEVELLRDDEVLRTVVERTGVGGRDWLHFLRLGEGHAQLAERAARRLAKRVEVEPIKKTNLIRISYAADDPRVAAKVLQVLASVYLEKHKAVHRPSGELPFFEQQTTTALEQLEESQEKLLRFTGERGIVSAAQQRDLALQKLSEMDATAANTRIEFVETGQRVSELEHLLAKLPERTTTQVRTADNAELMKSLKASLLDLQLKRTQLMMKFEPNHRLVQEVNEEISQAQTAIERENLRPVRDETTDKNPHYEWAKAELQQAQVQLKALLAREVAAENQAGAYRRMAGVLEADAITQDYLLASEKAAQENYLLYVKKQEEARMNDALDQRGIVNVAIAEQPVTPALPAMSVWFVLAIGSLASGMVGTGAAFVADYLDPSFRDPEDVLAHLEVPVLVSLPTGVGGRLSA